MAKKNAHVTNEIGNLLGTLSNILTSTEGDVDPHMIATELEKAAKKLKTTTSKNPGSPSWIDLLAGPCGKEEKLHFENLIKNGLDPNKAFPVTNGKWRTPLAEACSFIAKNSMSSSWIKFLLKIGADPKGSKHQNQERPLSIALDALGGDGASSLNNRLSIINDLLNAGAQWDSSTWGGALNHLLCPIFEKGGMWSNMNATTVSLITKISLKVVDEEPSLDDVWTIAALNPEQVSGLKKIKESILKTLLENVSLEIKTEFFVSLCSGIFKGIEVLANEMMTETVLYLIGSGVNPNSMSKEQKNRKALCLINERIPLTMPSSKEREELEKWIVILLENNADPYSILPSTDPLDVASTPKVKAALEKSFLNVNAEKGKTSEKRRI